MAQDSRASLLGGIVFAFLGSSIGWYMVGIAERSEHASEVIASAAYVSKRGRHV